MSGVLSLLLLLLHVGELPCRGWAGGHFCVVNMCYYRDKCLHLGLSSRSPTLQQFTRAMYHASQLHDLPSPAPSNSRVAGRPRVTLWSSCRAPSRRHPIRSQRKIPRRACNQSSASRTLWTFRPMMSCHRETGSRYRSNNRCARHPIVCTGTLFPTLSIRCFPMSQRKAVLSPLPPRRSRDYFPARVPERR